MTPTLYDHISATAMALGFLFAILAVLSTAVAWDPLGLAAIAISLTVGLLGAGLAYCNSLWRKDSLTGRRRTTVRILRLGILAVLLPIGLIALLAVGSNQ